MNNNLAILEWVFGGRMSFLTKPARIREETLDLATSSAAVEFCLHAVKFVKLDFEIPGKLLKLEQTDESVDADVCIWHS